MSEGPGHEGPASSSSERSATCTIAARLPAPAQRPWEKALTWKGHISAREWETALQEVELGEPGVRRTA